MADPTASSALHAPPTSYGEAAPPRKGILKNARSGSNTAQRPDDLVPPSEPEHPQPSGAAVPYRDSEGRLHWDESNLASNDYWKENTAPRMKIDEPKTPFVGGAQDPDDSDIPPLDDFTLDKPARASSESSVGSASSQSTHSAASAATKAELTRINTEANARLGQQQAAEVAERDESRTSSENGRASRSPSFSLPDGQHAPGRRRSSTSSGGWDHGAAASNGLGGSALSSEYEESSDEEEQEPMTVEEQRKHAAFTAKRKGHYGNEAEALRVARELMAKEDEEDEDEVEGGGLPPPPVPPVPQGYK